MINIPLLWELLTGSVSGSTVYGYFDNDEAFCSDAQKFAKLSGRKLGYPVISVLLTSGSFYTAYLNAVMEYSSIINLFNASLNMLSMHGVLINTSSNLTHRPINQNFSRIIRLSLNYANEVGMGHDVKIYSGSIQVKTNQQVYDLDLLFGDIHHPGDQILLHKVFYYRMPNSMRMWDPYLGGNVLQYQDGFGSGYGNNLGIAAQYIMMPLHGDALRMNAASISDLFRRAHYGFHLLGSTIRLFPVPRYDFKLNFQYTLLSLRTSLTSSQFSLDKLYISDLSNTPFKFMLYNKINSIGKSWIINYAHSVVKNMLGHVRGKLQTIPIPGSEISLDGDLLKSQSVNLMLLLRLKLRLRLLKMSKKNLMQDKQLLDLNLMNLLSKIPMYILIG